MTGQTRVKGMQTGEIIVAAGKKAHSDLFQPMIKIESLSAVLRLIKTFQQVGISAIVLMAGKEFERLEMYISRIGTVFLRNLDEDRLEMIDYTKIGLSYLVNKCEKVLITPVCVPLFTWIPYNVLSTRRLCWQIRFLTESGVILYLFQTVWFRFFSSIGEKTDCKVRFRAVSVQEPS